LDGFSFSEAADDFGRVNIVSTIMLNLSSNSRSAFDVVFGVSNDSSDGRRTIGSNPYRSATPFQLHRRIGRIIPRNPRCFRAGCTAGCPGESVKKASEGHWRMDFSPQPLYLLQAVCRRFCNSGNDFGRRCFESQSLNREEPDLPPIHAFGEVLQET
jgi:hypothetical protein